MTRAQVKQRIESALKSGPLYFGVLPLVVGASEQEIRGALADLHADGRVERAPEIGPQTFKLRCAVNGKSGGSSPDAQIAAYPHEKGASNV